MSFSGPRHALELSKAIEGSRKPSLDMGPVSFARRSLYFHCAVAISITALNNLVVTQEDPAEEMRHLSHTFRLINERLSKDDAVSDATIAVLVIMAQHERLQGKSRQGLVHLDGPQRMIELRGELSQFVRNRLKLIPKTLRADLEYSLCLGAATCFSIEDIISLNVAMLGVLSCLKRQGDQELLKVFHSRLFRQLCAELQSLLIDTTALAWLLNDANDGRRPRLNSSILHDILLLLGYRLIHLSPLRGPRPSSCLENAIYLGLTAFIMTFLRGLDRKIS